jgi:hypothetical protein
MASYSPGAGFRYTSGYSPNRISPIDGKMEAHRGQDFAAAIGTPVPAATYGVVQSSQWQSGFGNTVTIRHVDAAGNIFYTVYGHLDQPGLAVGTAVDPGTTIGVAGNTGISSGSHLHFEVIVNAAPTPYGSFPNVPDARIDPERGRIDPNSVDIPGSNWTTTVTVTPLDNGGTPLPAPSRLGGPTDLLNAANRAGWSTTVEYPDGTVHAGLKSGDTVTYSDGTKGTFTVAGASADGRQMWGTLALSDAAGRAVTANEVAQDGTVAYTLYDPANTQPYKTLTTTTDAQNRVDKVDTVFDDNHRVLKDFDEKNVNATAYTETTYDAQARVDLVSVVNDNGSSTATDYDQANAFSWAYQTTAYALDHSFINTGTNDTGTAWSNTFDIQGRLDYGYAFNAAGAVASFTDYDQTNIFNWRYNTTNYNADHSSTQVGVYDNNASWVNYNDAQGRIDVSYSLDSSNRVTSITDFDQTNASNIAFDIKTYNTVGLITDDLVRFDNGGTTQQFWDRSAIDWATYTSTYNAAGIIIDQIGRYDDNRTWDRDYDTAGRIDKWTIFDTAGRVDARVDYDDALRVDAIYRYDDANRLDSLTAYDDTNHIDWIKTYDDVNRLVHVSDYFPNGAHNEFSYNTVGLLVDQENYTASGTLTYDLNPSYGGGGTVGGCLATTIGREL